MPSEVSPIKNIVVLMMENRSFDHMLGFLPRSEGLKGVEGLTGKEFNLVDPADPRSEKVPATQGTCFAMKDCVRGIGPPHELLDVNRQLAASSAGPSPGCPINNQGFVYASNLALKSYLDSVNDPWPPRLDEISMVMRSFSPDQLPVLTTLASEFVLCDHWFCSVPGPTMPNRLYIHAATSGGYSFNAFGNRFDMRTIYNNLADAGRSWVAYHQNFEIIMNFTQVDYGAGQLRDYGQFKKDAAGGQLADYTFIGPRFIDWTDAAGRFLHSNAQHAPCDVRPGEALIADVYNTLRANPEVWRKTLLVVTYDEHGGFYDHVVPPSAPNPDGIQFPSAKVPCPDDLQPENYPAFDFSRLGLRVPTILISPWLPKKVDATVYDHSSVLATVKQHFGLADFLTERDRAANSFEQLLVGGTFREDTPERLQPLPLPDVPDPAQRLRQPLDPVQKEVMAGVMSHLPADTEHDRAERAAAWRQLYQNEMSQDRASALTARAIGSFKRKVRESGGAHPDSPRARAPGQRSP